MQAFFANQSCDPFTPESQPCVLGNYVTYAVNVSSTAHVAAALSFATKNNIRVVVRNTGHEYDRPPQTLFFPHRLADLLVDLFPQAAGIFFSFFSIGMIG